jgi:hypothetical protein
MTDNHSQNDKEAKQAILDNIEKYAANLFQSLQLWKRITNPKFPSFPSPKSEYFFYPPLINSTNRD